MLSPQIAFRWKSQQFGNERGKFHGSEGFDLYLNILIRERYEQTEVYCMPCTRLQGRVGAAKKTVWILCSVLFVWILMSKLRETGFYYLITINYCEVRIFLLRKLLIKYLTYLQPSHHQKVFSLTKVRSGPCQNMSLALNGSWSQNASRNAQMNLQGICNGCCVLLLLSVR